MRMKRWLKDAWPVLIFGILVPGALAMIHDLYFRYRETGLVFPGLIIGSVLLMAFILGRVDWQWSLARPNKVWHDFQEQHEEKQHGI